MSNQAIWNRHYRLLKTPMISARLDEPIGICCRAVWRALP